MTGKLFFILMSGCSLFSACAGERDLFHGEDAHQEEGQTLLTVSILLPESAGTRSQTNQEGGTGQTEVALDKECRVKDAWVFFGEIYPGQQAPLRISQRYHIREFHAAGNPAYWTATIPCQPGRYRLAVIVNPDPSIPTETWPGTNWDALARAELKYASYEALQHTWAENHFLMTNAYRGRNDDNDVVLETGRHTFKDLYVQRTCARFDYEAARKENRYDDVRCTVDGREQKLSVQLTHVGIMNLGRSFNLFKMVVPDVQPGRVPNFYQYETDENFVCDADWTEKWNLQMPGSQAEALKDLFFYPSERSINDPTPPAKMAFQPLSVAQNRTSILGYASENTLPGVLAQINKLSTGVVFKGTFRLPGLANPERKTVYYRELSSRNELYTRLDLLEEALRADGVILPFDGLTDKHLAMLGVRKFTSGADGSFPVYYTYWNRHNDNGDPTVMGTMEFAVVRNNVYKLKVQSISSLGLPLPPDDPANPWKPDGDTPDELLPHIDVVVEVCNWVTRHMESEI